MERIYNVRQGSSGKRVLESDYLTPEIISSIGTNLTQEDIANKLGIDLNTYKRDKKLLDLIPELQELDMAKQLPHGEWGAWLKDKVDFTQQTANKFMKCSTEFSNYSLTSNLGTGKLFELLDLPVENRDDFISTTHEVNGQTKTVDEMTTISW